MNTWIRTAIAVFLIVLCLSVAGSVTANVIPSLRAGGGVINPLAYNAQALLVAPFRVLSGLPLVLTCLVSVVLVALLLRRAFGDRPRVRHARGESEPVLDSSIDADMVAHKLDRIAHRLEERIEALETILLERERSRY